MSAQAQQLLAKCLTKPCQLAHSLDWKRATGSTLLAMDIHADRIGLARCDHPLGGGGLFDDESATSSSSCHPLGSIPLSHKTKITAADQQRLADLVKDHSVCGFVVAWPREANGKLGAACGRTLHALEQLLLSNSDGSTTSIVSPNRPLCLWDSRHRHVKTEETTDSFGRCAAYATTSTKTLHVASREQYHTDETIVAADVWQDFCRQYWPAVEAQQVDTVKTTAATATTAAKPPSLIGGRKTVAYTSGSWKQQQQQQQQRMAA